MSLFPWSNRYNSLSSFGLDIFPKFCSLKINMCGNIKSLLVWEGHELVILAFEIKECLNFADSPTRGLPAPNLRLLKVQIAFISIHFLKTWIRSSHLFKFWISQTVNKLSLFRKVCQPIWIVLPSILLRNSLPKGSSGVCKDCSLLINYYCPVMIAGKRSAFLGGLPQVLALFL